MSVSPASRYDEDFYAWTQEQAEALRRMPGPADAIDIAHLAEEIEDLGRRDLREVHSSLTSFFDLMIRVECLPESEESPQWVSDAMHSQSWANLSFSPSMRPLIDLPVIWRDASKIAGAYLQDVGAPPFPSIDCPYDLDQVLSEDFNVDKVSAAIAAARATDHHP